MQLDRQHFRVTRKVFIRRKNRPAARSRNRTNQEINVAALNALCSAPIEESRRALVILRHQRLIDERRHQIAQIRELFGIGNTGKNFLANRADDGGAEFFDEKTQLKCFGRIGRMVAAEGVRPN